MHRYDHVRHPRVSTAASGRIITSFIPGSTLRRPCSAASPTVRCGITARASRRPFALDHPPARRMELRSIPTSLGFSTSRKTVGSYRPRDWLVDFEAPAGLSRHCPTQANSRATARGALAASSSTTYRSTSGFWRLRPGRADRSTCFSPLHYALAFSRPGALQPGARTRRRSGRADTRRCGTSRSGGSRSHPGSHDFLRRDQGRTLDARRPRRASSASTEDRKGKGEEEKGEKPPLPDRRVKGELRPLRGP